MVDLIKRVCIALAIGVCISILFLGTQSAKAAGKDETNKIISSLIWPTVGEVTDTFGTRDGKHYGIDIAAVEGTPVVSIASGTVSRSYYSDTYGEVVFMEHDNGLETVYAHLHDRLVEAGQAIKIGEEIGTVGNTGRSSGNHLHFEVHNGHWNIEKTNAMDPMLVLSKEKEYQYASMGAASPYGESWKNHDYEEAVYVMAHMQNENKMDSSINEYIEQEKKGQDVLKKKGEPLSITVKQGDTLWSLSERFETSIEQIKEWNELASDSIYIGEALVVK
jgi:LysM repeat protein